MLKNILKLTCLNSGFFLICPSKNCLLIMSDVIYMCRNRGLGVGITRVPTCDLPPPPSLNNIFGKSLVPTNSPNLLLCACIVYINAVLLIILLTFLSPTDKLVLQISYITVILHVPRTSGYIKK